MRQIYLGSLYLMIVVLALSSTFSCKKAEEKKGEVGSESSALPVVSTIRILPEEPLSSDLLQAIVEPQTPTSGEYGYQWEKNGEEIMGERENTLESEHLVKGDRITVVVIPYQDEVEGEAKRSGPVIILNSLPVIESASIRPSPAYSKDDLEAVVDVFDADGDYIRYTYQWKKGSEEIPGETEAVLSNSHFKKGDKISYRVGVTDSESEEVVLNSNTATILNSPPRITSRSSGYMTEGLVYEYTAVAEDPDGDPLIFSLFSAPEGMTINSSTGMIRWELGEEQGKGSYEFKVIVTDAEGAMAIQPVTLTVSF